MRWLHLTLEGELLGRLAGGGGGSHMGGWLVRSDSGKIGEGTVVCGVYAGGKMCFEALRRGRVCSAYI